MFEEGQEILDKRYRVIKKLGGGAFGEIFKGRYTDFVVHQVHLQNVTLILFVINS